MNEKKKKRNEALIFFAEEKKKSSNNKQSIQWFEDKSDNTVAETMLPLL